MAEQQRKETPPVPAPSAPPAPSTAMVPVQQQDPFRGIAELDLDTHQQKVLTQPVDPKLLRILPTGEVYLPQVEYRRRLNKVFGPGAWAIKPLGKVIQQGNIVMREFQLWGRGRFVSQVAGEADYVPSNRRMSYATAIEAMKSNAVMRLCKDLGIASECWDREFTDAWREKYAIRVHIQGESRPQWRRPEDQKLKDETGIVGQDRPLPQTAQRKSAAKASGKSQQKPAQQTEQKPADAKPKRGPLATQLAQLISRRTSDPAQRSDILQEVSTVQDPETGIIEAGVRTPDELTEKQAGLAIAQFKRIYKGAR